MNQALIPARVTNMGVTVYKLKPADPQQMGLFDGTRLDTKSIARAEDVVNNKFGEFTLVPATMANMQDVILKRVPFGSVRVSVASSNQTLTNLRWSLKCSSCGRAT